MQNSRIHLFDAHSSPAFSKRNGKSPHGKSAFVFSLDFWSYLEKEKRLGPIAVMVGDAPIPAKA
jgi:hypothetical protein